MRSSFFVCVKGGGAAGAVVTIGSSLPKSKPPNKVKLIRTVDLGLLRPRLSLRWALEAHDTRLIWGLPFKHAQKGLTGRHYTF